MHHSFLIHSSADGHPGCSRVLAIVDSAAVNTVSLSVLVSSVCVSSSALLGRVAALDTHVFSGIAHWAPASTPTNTASTAVRGVHLWIKGASQRPQGMHKLDSCLVISSGFTKRVSFILPSFLPFFFLPSFFSSSFPPFLSSSLPTFLPFSPLASSPPSSRQ